MERVVSIKREEEKWGRAKLEIPFFF